MKISRTWLQTYFEAELPTIEQLADALTFHAFEIESVENDILDVKITANRGHDCLSHRGIAKELSAILSLPLKADLLARGKSDLPLGSVNGSLAVQIDDPALCRRYIGASIRGVKIGPSPAWLRERLESIGQKSISNVVDAANFVMFDIGQPLHAFDGKKLDIRNETTEIRVRRARAGERILALDDKEYALGETMAVIADGHSDAVLGVAGVKGGKESGVSHVTTDLILESANFDGPSLRKTSRALKFRTDATQRFEQGISPELAAYGMRAFIDLVMQVAGGELVGVVDAYPAQAASRQVTVSLAHINRVLGLTLSTHDVEDVFVRLGFAVVSAADTYTVTIPFERLDIELPEDLAEEVGRIIGYDAVAPVELPAVSPPAADADTARFAAIREHLVSQGFSEVFTSVFAEKGERAVSNKIGGDKPYLRSSLSDGLADALARNIRNKDLLGIGQVKIFEIGTVWRGGEEKIEVAIAVEKIKKQKAQEEYQKELDAFMSSHSHLAPRPPALPDIRYAPFSKYPFISRDIAFWTPVGTAAEDALAVIREHAGELLVQSYLFDTFEKEGRLSYAFRLVFQSMDRTLFDGDADSRMESIYAAMKEQGWEVR